VAKSILIIDNEEMILEALRVVLEGFGYRVDIYLDPFAGEQAALANDYNLILVDLRMPGKNGVEIVRSVIAKNKTTPLLVITGFPGDPLAEEALACGATDLIRKPFELPTILKFLEG